MFCQKRHSCRFGTQTERPRFLFIKLMLTMYMTSSENMTVTTALLKLKKLLKFGPTVKRVALMTFPPYNIPARTVGNIL